MPTCTSNPTRGALHLHNQIQYLGDGAHPAHRFYYILNYRTLDDAALETFAARISNLTDSYNRTVEPRHQIRTLGTAYYISFPKGSWLRPSERRKFSSMIREFACWDRLGVEAWHVNDLTGAADYNLVLPTIALDGVPVPRRTRTENIMAALRRKCDQILAEINELRAQGGIPQIGNVEERQLTNPARFPIERELAAVAKARGQVKVAIQHLPALLEAIGMSWEIDLQLRICLPLRRKPKQEEGKSRSSGLKFPAADVLRVVNIFLGQLWLEDNKTNKTNNTEKKELYENKDKEKNKDVGGYTKNVADPRPPDPDADSTTKNGAPPPQI